MAALEDYPGQAEDRRQAEYDAQQMELQRRGQPYDPAYNPVAQERAAATQSIDQIMQSQEARSALGSGARLPNVPMPVAPPPPVNYPDPTASAPSALGATPDARAALMGQPEIRNPRMVSPQYAPGAMGPGTEETLREHEAEPRAPSFYAQGRRTPEEPLAPVPGEPEPPPARDLEGQRARALGTGTTASSSTAAAVAATAPSGELKPGGALAPPAPAAEVKPDAPVRPKGGGGITRTATQERRHDEFPDATEKAQIDPQYLVRLEKSHPALHDSIVKAATAAGIGSWDLANMVYAMSKGDPGFRDKDGRMGLTGLTQEDITKYQQQYPELFRDTQGAPIPATDPATNLILGAHKYRDMMDLYGSRTPSAILANYIGPGRVDELARLNDPKQQRELIPAAAMTHVREAIGGPNAKAGTQEALALTDRGTLTGTQIVQAATAAAKSGDTRPFLRTLADGVPRGMASTDSWKHITALAVGAMVARGNYEGAKHASDLMFQMSHASTNQALMDAHRFLSAGDLAGAAHSMALSYYSAPDGGFAKFHIVGNQLIGQRFNEATGVKVGAPFPVTPATIQSMLNITQHPQEYGKVLRESQKLQADIEKTHAETEHKKAETAIELPAKAALTRAQAKYYEGRDEGERYRSDNAMEAKLLDINRKLLANPADAKELEVLRKHLDDQVPRFYPEATLEGGRTEITPEIANQRQIWHDMLMTNRNLDMGRAKRITDDLTGGKLFVNRHADGGGVAYNKPPDQGGVPLGVLLSPSTMALLARRPPPAAPPPVRIGATPAPAR